jgi:small subunit ribosomal protein S6
MKENETTIENISEADVKNKVYEISYILVPSLSETAATEKIAQIKESIASYGASFISEENPYMRDLAYEMLRVIKNVNQRFTTGYFGWVKFNIDADKVKEIEHKLKLDEDIIRFLLVKADPAINIFTKKSFDEQNTEGEKVNIDTSSEASNKTVDTTETKPETAESN